MGLIRPRAASGVRCQGFAGHVFDPSALGRCTEFVSGGLQSLLWSCANRGFFPPNFQIASENSERERDVYEELLTQAEIQGNINKVNSKFSSDWVTLDKEYSKWTSTPPSSFSLWTE